MRRTLIPALFVASWLFTLGVEAKPASEVFEMVSESVVVVFGLDDEGDKKSFGSGVVLPGGYIATNCHVIDDSSEYSVRHQKKEYPAFISHADWDRDVCILSAIGLNAPEVTLGNSHALKVGARVYAVGAPKGLELTLSDGIVSSFRGTEDGRYIQITAPISPGSSGGGLFDEEGQLMGLPTFFLTEGQQLNFAAPVEWIEQLLMTPVIVPEASTAAEMVGDAVHAEEGDDHSAQQKAEADAEEVRRQTDALKALEADSKRQADVARLVDHYRELIIAKVRGNTHLPEDGENNPAVHCVVRLLPTGEVYSVVVTQSSGNLAHDEAVVRSIEMSSPLPLPYDREARAKFVPELSLVYRPHLSEPQIKVASEDHFSQNTDRQERPGTTQPRQPDEPSASLQAVQHTSQARVIDERFTTPALKVDSPRSIGETPLMYAGFDRKPIPKGLDTISASESIKGEIPPRHHPANQAPRYPMLALGQRAEGRALVRAEIRPDGLVGQVWIKQSSGYQALDFAALETVRSWRFYPAQRHGMTVGMWMDVPIEYKVP